MKYLFTIIAISVVGVATIGCSGGLSEAEINQLIQTRVDARVKAEVSAALKEVKQGPQGVIGPIGQTGSTGAQGVAGPIGPTGGKGAKGSTGQIGATGATGLGAEALETTLFGWSGTPYTSNVFGDLEDSVEELERSLFGFLGPSIFANDIIGNLERDIDKLERAITSAESDLFYHKLLH